MADLVFSRDDLLSPSSVDPSAPSYWKAENHVAHGGAAGAGGTCTAGTDNSNYLRAEEWSADVEELMLPGRTETVPLTLAAGTALLRWREEVKMYAKLRDQGLTDAAAPGSDAKSIEDPAFLDAHEREARNVEWPASKIRSVWLSALTDLEAKLDTVIHDMHGGGAFIKLSVRSPKDAAFSLSRFHKLVRERFKEEEDQRLYSIAVNLTAPIQHAALSGGAGGVGSRMESTVGGGGTEGTAHGTTEGKEEGVGEGTGEGAGDETTRSDDVRIVKWAAWQSLKVRSGREAVRLLQRSERAYVDILQQELFSAGQKAGFDLSVHVTEFFEGFDPDWEFRGFVSQGKRTALTAYNPWVFDARQHRHKAQILARIVEVWDRAAPRVRCENYSIDFAVDPHRIGGGDGGGGGASHGGSSGGRSEGRGGGRSGGRGGGSGDGGGGGGDEEAACWIVEINAFLPPLAGCGLYRYEDPTDRKLLLEGPFSFRVRDKPATDADFVQVLSGREPTAVCECVTGV